jgi:hypothetical protein
MPDDYYICPICNVLVEAGDPPHWCEDDLDDHADSQREYMYDY